MDRDYFEKLADNPDFIPGIFNYCDRWCERCRFTARCMTFALEQEHFGDLSDRDEMNEVFWEKLAQMLEFTLTMIKEDAEYKGIDLDSLIDDEEREQNLLAEKSVVHIITHMAKVYADQADDWLDFNVYDFLENEYEPDTNSGLELVQPEEAENINDIFNIVEVIRWYQHQIYVKLKRAVSDNFEETGMELDDFQQDSDGSAKVALIGIDRSISAWGKMLEYFQDDKTGIIKQIAFLKNLRNRVENVFPNARAFIRPGFDEAH